MSEPLPILYYDYRSPCNRSVLMLINVLNIPILYKFIDLFKLEHKHQEFRKINFFHTLPCLKDKDVLLSDSHAILMYLSEIYGENTPFKIKKEKQRAVVVDRMLFHATKQFERGKIIMVSKKIYYIFSA